MRARLITVLALGCCLQVGRASADDFDDDFGALPPSRPRPTEAAQVAAERASPAPGPSESPPAASPGAAPPTDPVEPGDGDYPPLDADDAPLPADRLGFLHPSIDGLLGGLHVIDASSARPGSFRVAVNGGFFRKDGFLARHDQHRQGNGSLVLNVTPIEHLELAALVSMISTENRTTSPNLLQAVGDTHLFAKGFAHVLPWLAVGGDLELALLNGVGSVGVRNGATNVGLRASATADLRALPRRGLPLIARSNLRYLFDNSGKLARSIEDDRYRSLDNPTARGDEYRHLVTPGERYALGINRLDQLAISFGVEAPLEPHPRVNVNPMLEWSVAVPVNRQGYDCLKARAEGDRCLASTGFSTRASNLSMGVRVQPYVSGLGVLLALDIATSGARDFVRELAPQSRYMVRFALSYAYDPRVAGAARTRVQRIEIPVASARGHIVGQVVDAQSGTPLANAIVHFENTSLSDVVSDEAGAFRSAELSPGAQGMRVRAEGYREALCVAVLSTQGSDVSARCELTPSAYYGTLEGRITDNRGRPLANARLSLHGASELSLNSGADGTFRESKLLEGDYELVASAEGYFPRTQKLTIARGSAGAPPLALIPRPKRPVTRVTPQRIVLATPVVFAPDSAILSAESEPLLAEVAEQLQKHPELKQLEIQAHGEDTPGTTPLTQQRADAVRAWLIREGIESERLIAKGYGQTRPLVPNITPANRARNRRIELVVK